MDEYESLPRFPIDICSENCSRLKQGSRRDGHPRLESYFHDGSTVMVGAPPSSDVDWLALQLGGPESMVSKGSTAELL